MGMQKDPSLVVLCPVFGAEFHPPRLCAPFASPPVHSRPISQSREIHMPMPDGRKKRIEPLRGKEEAESHPKQEVPFPPFPSESDGPAALLILTLFGVRGGGKIKKFRMPPRPSAPSARPFFRPFTYPQTKVVSPAPQHLLLFFFFLLLLSPLLSTRAKKEVALPFVCIWLYGKKLHRPLFSQSVGTMAERKGGDGRKSFS